MGIKNLGIKDLDALYDDFEGKKYYKVSKHNITEIVDKINEIVEIINDKYATAGENQEEER